MQLRMITLILLTLTISCGNDTTGPAPEETARFLSADPVEFTTSDGFLIRGTFFHDTGRPTAKPVVILLHAFGSSHLDWFTFALDLVDFRNFVVLAIDLRGHGASNFQNGIDFPIQNFTTDDLNSMPIDLEASIAYLKTRPEADASRVGIVGVDIGANLAFIGAGTLPEVKAAVSISPQYRENQAQGILIGTNLPNFQPTNVLFVASFGDGYAYTSSQTMSGLTQGSTQVVGIQGLAHGMDILISSEAWNQVMDWLSSNL
jgi:pimeloyl-ACP methyl ester carboxylesterase